MDAISPAEKADVLYQKGKFDEALLFYDKGHRDRRKSCNAMQPPGSGLMPTGPA